MKHRFRSILGLGLLPALCLAQQNVARPVIPAPPPQPPAAVIEPPPAAAPVDTTQPQTQPASGLPGSPTGSLPTQASPSNAPRVSSSYIIGPEDAITVNVWKEPTVSGSFSVRPDGMISLPLLGDLLASGMTPMALGGDIATRLKKYLTDPLVTVTVTAVNSKHYYMVGEVGHPGSLPLTPGMTPLQAIAASGGLSPYANASHIYILRTDKGKQLKIPFNYKKAIKNGNQQGVSLLPDDTIVVP